jgi:hypothetical protein
MIDRIAALADVLRAKRTDASAGTATGRGDDAVVDIAQRSFRLALLQALDRKPATALPDAAAASPPSPPVVPSAIAPDDVSVGTSSPAAVAQAISAYASTPSVPAASALARSPSRADERRIIDETAARAGVDPAFLQALRRVENGGPGREFGVLSVPAPTYQDQARVAADSIRRSVERFTARGGTAVDAATGRYTPEFIAFFSRRYAPIGVANDPANLNRHHTRNLLRVYSDAASGGVA